MIHDLLLAKLYIYVFDRDSRKFFYNHLSHRYAKQKLIKFLVRRVTFFLELPQGSSFGPLFNICINDLFYMT